MGDSERCRSWPTPMAYTLISASPVRLRQINPTRSTLTRFTRVSRVPRCQSFHPKPLSRPSPGPTLPAPIAPMRFPSQPCAASSHKARHRSSLRPMRHSMRVRNHRHRNAFNPLLPPSTQRLTPLAPMLSRATPAWPAPTQPASRRDVQ